MNATCEKLTEARLGQFLLGLFHNFFHCICFLLQPLLLLARNAPATLVVLSLFAPRSLIGTHNLFMVPSDSSSFSHRQTNIFPQNKVISTEQGIPISKNAMDFFRHLEIK